MTVFVNVFLVAISGFGQLKADSAKANQDADVVRGCLKADAQPAAMCLGEERDTDGDGLCDFQEIHKYLTDPTKSDTDSDGIGDGDWQERREYTYTVRTIIHFMPPFDRAALNDGFQDARVLEMRNDYIELEVIHYPLGTAEDIVVANPNWRRDYTGMTQYLKRGITTNWDAKMREDVLAELKTDGIDIDKLSDKQVVEQVSSWLLKKSRSPGDVFTTYYVHYAGGKPYVYPGLEGAFEREFNKVRDSCNWTIEEHFDYELLGKGMFYNKTHGTCTSVAVYLTTVLRAVGIPTRMIIVVPAVDASDGKQLHLVRDRIGNHKVRETMLAGLRRSRQGFTAHTFNEVYVGNRWHRLNYSKLGQPVLDQRLFGLHTHLYTFNDLSEANLAPTWGRRYGKGEKSVVFKHSNPYRAVVISDLFGKHSNVPNPPVPKRSAGTSSDSRPNIYVMSPRSFVGWWDEFVEIVDDVTANKTGRSHEIESYDEVFIDGIWGRKAGDIVVLLFSLDTKGRIPAKYADLLLWDWRAIEGHLKQDKTLEVHGKARDLNVILLAAPTTDGLRQLVRESKQLRALSGQDKTSFREHWIPIGQTKGPVVYTVTIPEENWRKAKVSCQMKTEGVLSLSMNNNGAPRVPDGHASFVHNLTVVDSEGNTLPIKNFGDARWKIQSKENQPLTLSYEVLLKHDKSDLPWGRDEAPYVTEDGAFWTGRALFIKGDMSNITVRFNLPEGWHVTAPWQLVSNQLPTFLLEDEQELTESFLFAGTHIEEQAKVGDTEILLAVGNRMQKSKDLIQEAVQKFLNEYEEVFGGSPKTRTLIVTNRQDRKGSFDGGVFGRSISVLMGDEPTENNTQRWAPFIAHEVFHLWNGQIIEHSGQENWFSEGFTDYYAMVVCVRSGMIDEQEFIQRLKRACKQYLSKSGQTPIRKAREYALQYAGGSLVAASLDIQIRKLTNNTRSLDHLMQQMYLEFGETSKKYDLEDVIRLVNNITGKDLTSFFEKYVSGTEELPLSDYLGYIGMDLKKEVTEELPDLAYVVHKMLNIQSLMHSGLVIRRSHEAGYQDEDRLIAIAGTPVNNTKDMQTVAASLKRGEKIQVGLLRDGKEVTLEITVGGDQQNPPLERKVEISLEKIASLNSSQKSILSGITR